MDENQKIRGIKKFLRRTKTLSELEDLAITCAASATEEVVITSIGTEGSSSSGQVSFPKWLLLNCLEDLIEEDGGGRQLMTFGDFGGMPSQT
jgi:hypothetical protein